MALWWTEPLTEMSTRNILGGKGRPARKAANLIAICEPIARENVGASATRTLWVSTACYRDSFTFFTFMTPSGRMAQLIPPQPPGSLFVALFDSQGYDGGILTSLHRRCHKSQKTKSTEKLRLRDLS
jgi:hypothetical protein